MMILKRMLLSFAMLVSLCASGQAQSNEPLVFGTVHRPPFAYTEDAEFDGFSIALMREIAGRLDREVVFEPNERFGDMLTSVRAARVDGAIANISITAERERAMDFSQPIFGSGIQILLPKQTALTEQFLYYLGNDVLYFVIAAALLVLIGWGLMRALPDRGPAALSGGAVGIVAVVAGFALLLVAAGTITARITVNALQANVQTISDLEARIVGTVAGSTSDEFLRKNGINFQGFGDPRAMLAAFERDEINTVVFDGPILAHYLQTEGQGIARLIEKVYRPENYGILMPAGSALKEQIDLTLLELREDGTYDRLLTKWFGNSYVPN
ncbi:MAG: transporter substrate-binding domain-containing protein [Pseudomonadota bacterium]